MDPDVESYDFYQNLPCNVMALLLVFCQSKVWYHVVYMFLIHLHVLTPGRSVLMQSEQASYSNGGSASVSIDMDSVQRDQTDQMQLVEQQVCRV